MCSISGSFSKSKLIELVDLNRYRGEYSHSITYIDKELDVLSLTRKFGSVNVDDIRIPESAYCIIHQQAPTTENVSFDHIHPAQNSSALLWHNGILKQTTIKKLQDVLKSSSTWDSFLLLDYLTKISSVPKDIDGSFACVFHEVDLIDGAHLWLFRNEIAPLFIDTEMNISSTKFDGSEPVQPNTMISFNPFKSLVRISEFLTFTTIDNPYLLSA